MSIVVIGINHRTGPLSLLERVAVPSDALAKALHGLVARRHVREAVVLSTCNRTEVYAVTEKFHGAYADIRDFFCELAGLPPDDLHAHLYSEHDDAAVAHLFEVASGLDSAVLGETEILGQVRAAWEHAREEGAARSALNLLFRHALEVGKRARTDTGISRHTASVSSAAVEMAEERLGGLAGRRVLVIGAGDMGAGIAVALRSAGTESTTVTNRTPARATNLARRIGGRTVDFASLTSALAAADLALTCTGSGAMVVAHHVVEAAMATRPDRPLLIVDIAVPRDVEPSVAGLGAVTLLDLDDLRDWAARGLDQRAAESAAVRAIVSEEVERHTMDAMARQAAPLVSLLHERAEAVRQTELQRQARRLASLDPAQRAAVETLTKGIVAKLLHGPSVRLKDGAGTPAGERYAAALRELFDLPE